LVDCGDLATFLEAIGDTGGLGEARVWKMLAELSTAISLIHDHNLIHLDIKPANILVTAEGSLKIADFGMSAKTSTAGLAVAASPPLPSEGENGNFTWSSDLESTPELEKDREGDRAYLAPEGLSEGRFGRESDIFR
jgi:mitosis inhibitor protein kinase SWE1